MASNAELSMNARKLQVEEIERLVKCRVRSEIEARKAVEATMKRAVQEARELKKELMLMRQDKEEAKQDTKKTAMAVATTPAPGGVVTKDDLQKKLHQEKSKRKEVTTRLEATQHELKQLRGELEQREAQLAKSQSLKEDALRKTQDELSSRQRELESLQGDAKKLKSAADEAKRKCQRLVKDKKEELQQLMDENAQLAKRCEAAERIGDENAKLRKLLEKTKDKQGEVADEWQRRLDQREQAFLRQEQDNKKRLAEKQGEIDALTEEKDALVEQLTQLESVTEDSKQAHAVALEREDAKFHELVDSTKQLQQRLQTLKDAGRAADRARLDAEARLAHAEALRETAEAAADAVESRAEKVEVQLQNARQQLEQVERALKKKGITIDFLIKAGSSSSNSNTSNNSSSKATTTKEPTGPEEHDVDEPSAVPKKKLLPSTVAGPPAIPKDKDKTKTAPRATPSVGANVPTRSLLTKAKPISASARDGNNNNHSHLHADREVTPERGRK